MASVHSYQTIGCNGRDLKIPPFLPRSSLEARGRFLKFLQHSMCEEIPKTTVVNLVPTSRLFLAHNRLFLVSLQIGKKAQGEGGTGGVQVGARDRSLGP